MPSPRAKKLVARLLEVLAVLLLASLGVLYAMKRASSTGFLVEVADHQVALLVDNRAGSVRVDDTPGYHALVPWLQDAYLLDKSPVEYRMQGDAWANYNHVPALRVRAADGSRFSFESVQIQYAVRPEDAWQVLSDAGPEYGWHHGPMDAVARSILADEFGRHTAAEIVRSEVQRDATLRAQQRLGAALLSRGLVVREILTSKPIFPAEYESVVQRRKVADREIETLVQQLEQLSASRDERLAKLRRDRELALSLTRDQLTTSLSKSERDAERTRAEADLAYDARVRAGEQRLAELLSEADSATERYAKEAEGMRAKADALAAQGELAVRKRLIESLSKVEFSIEPFETPEAAAAKASSYGGI